MQSRRHHADHTNYPDLPLPGETFGFAANQSFPNLCWAAWRVVSSAAPITVRGVLVAEGAGLQAAVQDADEPVRELA